MVSEYDGGGAELEEAGEVGRGPFMLCLFL